MTLSYNLGMAVGSIMGYLFDNIIGEKTEDITTVCPVYPYGPYLSHMPTTTEKSKSVITSTLYSILNLTQQQPFGIEPTILSSLELPVENGTYYYESTMISNMENDTYL